MLRGRANTYVTIKLQTIYRSRKHEYSYGGKKELYVSMREFMNNTEHVVVNVGLVSKLIASQFPQWGGLPIHQVETSGWDNRTFHLGEEMLIRMPSAACYELQVEKEHQWLPKLAPQLPYAIPTPLALGSPGFDYLWHWSVYRWIDGVTASSQVDIDRVDLAIRLAAFLTALQQADATDGPLAGEHSFYRGAPLTTYDLETRNAITALGSRISSDRATQIWETALDTKWQHTPVWVHGDLALGNLLLQNGKLHAVIDFGQLCIGDPACDLAIAWTLFSGQSREAFQEQIKLDAGTWARGRAWALWKALITAADLTGGNNFESQHCWQIINNILRDDR